MIAQGRLLRATLAGAMLCSFNASPAVGGAQASATSTPLRVTTPNTPARWGINTHQRLAWTYDGDAPQFQIDISRDGGGRWDYLTTIANAPGDSQNLQWRVTGPPTSAARLRVTAIGDRGATDVNDGVVRISPAAISFIAPTASTLAVEGNNLTVRLEHNLGARKPLAVDLSLDGGGTWVNILEAQTRGATTSTEHIWLADGTPTTRARVRVRARDGSGASARSASFVIEPFDLRLTGGWARADLENQPPGDQNRFGEWLVTAPGVRVSGEWATTFPCGGGQDRGCRDGEVLQFESGISEDASNMVLFGRRFRSGSVELSIEANTTVAHAGVVTSEIAIADGTIHAKSADGKVLLEVLVTAGGTMRAELRPSLTNPAALILVRISYDFESLELKVVER